GPEFHGKTHVAGDLELALHESRSAVEFALDHLVEGIERHRNRAVSRLSGAVTDRIGFGLSVNQDAAGIAEVELERAAEARIGADGARHLRDDLLYRRRAHDDPSHFPLFSGNLPAEYEHLSGFQTTGRGLA